MPEIYIDLPRAVELVLELIAEKPEGYRYLDNPLAANGVCRNILWSEVMLHPNQIQPGCIVGSAVIKAGVTPLQIFSADCTLNGVTTLIPNLRAHGIDIRLTDAARVYFGSAQARQDDGLTWAKSHSIALQRILEDPESLNPAELEWLEVRNWSEVE